MVDAEVKKVTRKTVWFSYLVQFFQYGTSILVLPFILSMLSAKTMGVWYIFLSVSSIAALIDFGFSSSLSRNISYVFSGADHLLRNGVPDLKGKSAIDYNLLFSLIYTSKRTYGIIAVTMFFFFCFFGTPYIMHATRDSGIDDIIIVWLFFALSTAINYYYNYVIIFLKGKGEITKSNSTIIISRISYIIIVFVLISSNLELWALVIANIASAFIGRVIGNYYFWDKQLKKQLSISKKNKENLFPIIWYNAKKFGLSSFTNYAFSQANVLLAGFFLTIEDVASLGLALQLFHILITICRVYFNTFYPIICGLWVSNNVIKIRQIFIKSQLVGYSLGAIGFFFIIMLGNPLLSLIGSKTNLPCTGVLLIYALFYLMELTHGNCSMLISSRNEIPFLKASIIACITSICLMIVFAKCGLGLYTFPLAMVIANIPYNSWKWVFEAYKILIP